MRRSYTNNSANNFNKNLSVPQDAYDQPQRINSSNNIMQKRKYVNGINVEEEDDEFFDGEPAQK